MEIIAFFSFKGGVGRTSLMTHVGAYWASRGKVVVLADMDLAAPGLSFSPLMGDWLDERGTNKGFSDLLAIFHQYKSPNNSDEFGFVPPSILLREMHPPEGDQWGNQGRVLGMDAGSVRFRYPMSIEDEKQRNFPPKEGRADENADEKSLRAFAKLFRDDLEQFRLPIDGRNIDYVLIDCRTGFPELLDLSLGFLADRWVLVSGLNQQNLAGLELTIQSLKAERLAVGELARLVTVFSPVPMAGEEDPMTLAAIQAGQKILDSARRKLPDGSLEAGAKSFQIHYTSHLAVSDIPLITTRPDHPYCQEVIKIANWLKTDSLSEHKLRIFQQATQATGTIEVTSPSDPMDATDLKNTNKHLPEKSSPPTRKTSKAINPILQLPPWFWPLGEERAAITRLSQLTKMTPEEVKAFPDEFLNNLSRSIAFSNDQKHQLLINWKHLNPGQRKELTTTVAEENQKLSAMQARQYNELLKSIYEQQKNWAILLVTPPMEGLRRFLLWPLTEQAPFPEWGKTYHDYWLMLAHDILTELPDEQQAHLALSRAKTASTNRDELVEKLASMANDFKEESSQALFLTAAHAVAGQDLWKKLLILENSSNPNPDSIESIVTPLLIHHPENDPKGVKCYALGRWILANHPHLAIAAESIIQKAVLLNPQYPAPHNILGILFHNHLHRFDEAENAYKEAIRLDPKNAIPWNNLGNLLQNHLNRFEEAENAYKEAIRLDPKDAAPCNGLGSLYQTHQLSCQKALSSFDTALFFDIDNPYLHMNRGHLLLIMGDSNQWRKELKQALTKFKTITNNHAFINQIRLTAELSHSLTHIKNNPKLQKWLTQNPKDFLHLLTIVILTMAQKKNTKTPLQNAMSALHTYANRIDAIKIFYLLAGTRPDLREHARQVATTLFYLPEATLEQLKGVPTPATRLACFQPFVAGHSIGAGDPSDRKLFCKDLE